MTTKDLILAEIDSLSEKYLDELYALIKDFTQSKQQEKKQSFMSKLKSIKIDASDIRVLTAESPSGVPGRELRRFAGTIEPDDLQAMAQAIEEGCEKVVDSRFVNP